MYIHVYRLKKFTFIPPCEQHNFHSKTMKQNDEPALFFSLPTREIHLRPVIIVITILVTSSNSDFISNKLDNIMSLVVLVDI